MFLYSLISAHISCYYSNNKYEGLLPYPVKKYLNRKISYFFSFIPKKHYTFALAIETIHLFRLQNGNHHWRDGRVVDYNGLENRRAERHRGFESLSLRKQGCKSASYAIYTLYYTQNQALKKKVTPKTNSFGSSSLLREVYRFEKGKISHSVQS